MDKVLGGKLSIAQVNSPPRVLDLGCGTGIWAIEFGMIISPFFQLFMQLGEPVR